MYSQSEKAICDYTRDYLKDHAESFIDFVLLVYPNTAAEFIYDNDVDFIEFMESVNGYDTL